MHDPGVPASRLVLVLQNLVRDPFGFVSSADVIQAVAANMTEDNSRPEYFVAVSADSHEIMVKWQDMPDPVSTRIATLVLGLDRVFFKTLVEEMIAREYEWMTGLLE